MNRPWILMTLALALGQGVAMAQEPAPKPAEPPKPQPATAEGVRVDLPVNTAYELLAQELKTLPADPFADAIANHPYVRVAEARLQEANAQLAVAKLKVATELRTNKIKLQNAKAAVEAAEANLKFVEVRKKGGLVNDLEYSMISQALAAAKLQLALQEELATMGSPPTQRSAIDAVWLEQGYFAWRNGALTLNERNFTRRLVNDLDQRAIDSLITGNEPAERLRSVLKRSVKLAVTDKDTDRSVIGVLKRGLKAWGFDDAKIVVRYPTMAGPESIKNPPSVSPIDGDNTVGTWLMLMLDDFNGQADTMPEPLRGKYDIYVREYGLLMTKTSNSPEGALRLADFLRMPTPKKPAEPKTEAASPKAVETRR